MVLVFGAVVVVVLVLVPPVTGRVVEVVVDDVLDEVVVDVLLDEAGGSLDGTHRMANRPSKNRRRGRPTAGLVRPGRPNECG